MKFTYENYSVKVFPGFYETSLCYSDMFCNEECKDGFCIDFRKGGFQDYKKETCEDWVFEMRKQIKENPVGLKIIGLSGIRSPKEYNFYTDTIKIDIFVNLTRLKKYCLKDNAENFDNYLSKEWTSEEGFVSFIPDSLGKFKHTYKASASGRLELINVMIEFFLLESIDFLRVECSVLENEFDRTNGKLALIKDDDGSMWDYEYSESGYIPTVKVA